MGEWIWRDDEQDLGLRTEDRDGVQELAFYLNQQPIAFLDRKDASDLVQALRVWATGSAKSIPGTSFQVYYQHEYRSPEGDIVPCDDLGPTEEDDAYTYDEATIADVRTRVAWIGEKVASLHARFNPGSPDIGLPESARAWVSVFRMPDDVRVWKGYFDEFAEVPDEELLE